MPRLCLAAILSVALFACKEEPTPPPGDVASTLALTTIDGAAFDPATLRGRPALVMFWRTGCSYCMKEMPVVAKVARDQGAVALAVLVAGNRERARRVAETFDGTVLVDDGTAARAFLGEQSASTLAGAITAVR